MIYHLSRDLVYARFSVQPIFLRRSCIIITLITVPNRWSVVSWTGTIDCSSERSIIKPCGSLEFWALRVKNWVIKKTSSLSIFERFWFEIFIKLDVRCDCFLSRFGYFLSKPNSALLERCRCGALPGHSWEPGRASYKNWLNKNNNSKANIIHKHCKHWDLILALNWNQNKQTKVNSDIFNLISEIN